MPYNIVKAGHDARSKPQILWRFAMILSDLFLFKICDIHADFWLVRSSTVDYVGDPVRNFSPDYIGVTVKDRSIILPDFAFWQFKELYRKGVFKRMATGSIQLVHIRISDLEKIRVAE